MANNLFFLIGASGAGKTTTVKKLEKNQPENLAICYSDNYNNERVPSFDEMIKEYGSTEEWQKANTIKQVQDIKDNLLRDKSVFFDIQSRPSFIQEACDLAGIEDFKIILFDCNDEIRIKRLNQRKQPELANEQMMNWAKYLREQCTSESCLIIDNSKLSIEQCVELLRNILV